MSFLMTLRNACGKIHFGMMLQIYKISGYDLYRKPNIFLILRHPQLPLFLQWGRGRLLSTFFVMPHFSGVCYFCIRLKSISQNEEIKIMFCHSRL